MLPPLLHTIFNLVATLLFCFTFTRCGITWRTKVRPRGSFVQSIATSHSFASQSRSCRYRNRNQTCFQTATSTLAQSLAHCFCQTTNASTQHQFCFHSIKTSLHNSTLVRGSATCFRRYWQPLGCLLALPSTLSMQSPPLKLWEPSSSTAMEHNTSSRACHLLPLCVVTANYFTGIAYQLTEADPLVNADQCKLDAASMQTLGANAIRVYHVDPNGDHSGCMSAFADAGIYLFVDLSTFNTAIDPVSFTPSSHQIATNLSADQHIVEPNPIQCVRQGYGCFPIFRQHRRFLHRK